MLFYLGMVVGVYSVNAFMNKKHRQQQKDQAKKKTDAANSDISLTKTKHDQQEHAKKCCLGENKPEALHPVSRWLRFKNWFARVTPAELVTALLTGVIACATIKYANISEQQWNTMQRQLDDAEATTRARLFIEDFNPTLTMGEPSQGMFIKGSFVMTNVGGTVANEIYFTDNHWGSYRIPGPLGDNTPLPDTNGLPGIASETFNSGTTHYPALAPGKSLEYPVGTQEGQWAQVQDGKWFVGDFITVTYQNIFQKTITFQDCL